MTQYVCILQCGELCDSTDTISIERWSKLKEKTKEWRGLDKFGCVYETTQWEQFHGIFTHQIGDDYYNTHSDSLARNMHIDGAR